MKDVVIEIDGTKHKLYNKDKVVCGCQVCSLQELCTTSLDYGICFPFLSNKQYGHFELDKKKK